MPVLRLPAPSTSTSPSGETATPGTGPGCASRRCASPCAILRQAMDGFPEGDHRARAPRNIEPPAGEVYSAVEGPRGEVGFYIVSDGTRKPYRVKMRKPSFSNFSALSGDPARPEDRRPGGRHGEPGPRGAGDGPVRHGDSCTTCSTARTRSSPAGAPSAHAGLGCAGAWPPVILDVLFQLGCGGGRGGLPRR